MRRAAAGVPEEVLFATKPAIALVQLSQAVHEGGPPGVVLADGGYGDETAFRDAITALGLRALRRGDLTGHHRVGARH